MPQRWKKSSFFPSASTMGCNEKKELFVMVVFLFFSLLSQSYSHSFWEVFLPKTLEVGGDGADEKKISRVSLRIHGYTEKFISLYICFVANNFVIREGACLVPFRHLQKRQKCWSLQTPSVWLYFCHSEHFCHPLWKIAPSIFPLYIVVFVGGFDGILLLKERSLRSFYIKPRETLFYQSKELMSMVGIRGLRS